MHRALHAHAVRALALAFAAVLLLQSCSCGGSAVCDLASGHESVSLHVSDHLTLPQSGGDLAFDLNGDGVADNAFGNIVSALSSLGVSSQAAVDQTIAGGNGLLLLRLISSDPALTSTPCAKVVLRNAAQQSNPDFSGGGAFRIDPAFSGLDFPGTLETAIGTFTAADPAIATATPVAGNLSLPLISRPLALPVTGGHLRTVASGSTLTGQINIAVPKSAVDGVILPSIAATCQAAVDADPASSTARQLLQRFDNGGTGSGIGICGATCTNPDATCALGGDGRIDVCEVGTDASFSVLLAPDVQIFATDGSYAPSAANAVKDSFSIGLSFTMVSGRF